MSVESCGSQPQDYSSEESTTDHTHSDLNQSALLPMLLRGLLHKRCLLFTRGVVRLLNRHREPGLLECGENGVRVSLDSLLHRLIRVVPAKVLYHLEPLPGPVAAVQALVGLLVGVGEVVVLQAGGPAEGLGAHVADERPLLAVLHLVGLEQEARLEGLAALLADEGARVAVARLLVHAQSVGPIGAILALVTRVRLCS